MARSSNIDNSMATQNGALPLLHFTIQNTMVIVPLGRHWSDLATVLSSSTHGAHTSEMEGK